jgi:hypothetical protein
MGPTQIAAAIAMVGVTVAIIVWFQSSQAAASARRMMGMMTRVGLDPGAATIGDPRAMAIRKEVRRRCGGCPREDLCDRWLAGEVKGGNTFCPNAQAFQILAGASGHPNATASRA